LIAAFISRAGVCAGLLEDVMMEHAWVASDFIVGEVQRKLKEKFLLNDAAITEAVSLIVTSAEIGQPTDLPLGSCRDPADVPILGTAVAGNAQALVTVDKDLLALKSLGPIAIIRPGEFFAWSRNPI
jgi:uncharacterized protein